MSYLLFEDFIQTNKTFYSRLQFEAKCKYCEPVIVVTVLIPVIFTKEEIMKFNLSHFGYFKTISSKYMYCTKILEKDQYHDLSTSLSIWNSHHFPAYRFVNFDCTSYNLFVLNKDKNDFRDESGNNKKNMSIVAYDPKVHKIILMGTYKDRRFKPTDLKILKCGLEMIPSPKLDISAISVDSVKNTFNLDNTFNRIHVDEFIRFYRKTIKNKTSLTFQEYCIIEEINETETSLNLAETDYNFDIYKVFQRNAQEIIDSINETDDMFLIALFINVVEKMNKQILMR